MLHPPYSLHLEVNSIVCSCDGDVNTEYLFLCIPILSSVTYCFSFVYSARIIHEKILLYLNFMKLQPLFDSIVMP